MAGKKKNKDSFMSFVIVCFVLFCAVKVVSIQKNITDKEAQLQSLETLIQQQQDINKDMERQLEVGNEDDNLGRVAFEQYGYGYVDEHVYIDSSGS